MRITIYSSILLHRCAELLPQKSRILYFHFAPRAGNAAGFFPSASVPAEAYPWNPCKSGLLYRSAFCGCHCFAFLLRNVPYQYLYQYFHYGWTAGPASPAGTYLWHRQNADLRKMTGIWPRKSVTLPKTVSLPCSSRSTSITKKKRG